LLQNEYLDKYFWHKFDRGLTGDRLFINLKKVFWESISINQDDPTYLSTLPTSFIEQALRLGTAYLNLNNAVLNGPSNFDQISNNLKYLSVSADRKVMPKNLNEFQTFITFNPKHLLLSTDSLEKLSLDLLTEEIVDGILKNSPENFKSFEFVTRV